MFELRLLLLAEMVVPFGNSVGEICISFPRTMAGGISELQALLEEASPDMERICLVLQLLASASGTAMQVGDVLAKLIGRSEPVRIEGGPVQ